MVSSLDWNYDGLEHVAWHRSKIAPNSQIRRGSTVKALAGRKSRYEIISSMHVTHVAANAAAFMHTETLAAAIAHSSVFKPDMRSPHGLSRGPCLTTVRR